MDRTQQISRKMIRFGWSGIFLFYFLVLNILGLNFLYAQNRLKISSTTSTENSGLFEVLNPPFEKQFNCRVDVIAVGTGKALKIGAAGDVDVVFVHAREAEDLFIAQGNGINRRDVMYNDFVILGPQNDPAKIEGYKDAKKAFAAIAQKKARFISRGDNSGTHKKEMKLWQMAGIEPQGKWYSEAGQGMGAVINLANEKKAYTLADRGTFLAFSQKINLQVLTEGDKDLFNPYGIMAVSPSKFSHVNYTLAMAYIGWVTSVEGQKIIKSFGIDTFGQPLFNPSVIP